MACLTSNKSSRENYLVVYDFIAEELGRGVAEVLLVADETVILTAERSLYVSVRITKS